MITIIMLIAAVFIIGLFLGKMWGKKGSKQPVTQPQRTAVQWPSSEDEQAILQLTKQNGKITNAEVQSLCDVSAATAERYLQKLESQGKLQQVGNTGRDVTYEIN